MSDTSEDVRTFDLTPTWGEFGRLANQLVQHSESKALLSMCPEIAKAMTTAQALLAIKGLSKEQGEVIAKTLANELSKQGY